MKSKFLSVFISFIVLAVLSGRPLAADPDYQATSGDNSRPEKSVELDANRDGILDERDLDRNGDGVIDHLDLDANQDGIVDQQDLDLNKDGVVNAEDLQKLVQNPSFFFMSDDNLFVVAAAYSLHYVLDARSALKNEEKKQAQNQSGQSTSQSEILPINAEMVERVYERILMADLQEEKKAVLPPVNSEIEEAPVADETVQEPAPQMNAGAVNIVQISSEPDETNNVVQEAEETAENKAFEESFREEREEVVPDKSQYIEYMTNFSNGIKKRLNVETANKRFDLNEDNETSFDDLDIAYQALLRDYAGEIDHVLEISQNETVQDFLLAADMMGDANAMTTSAEMATYLSTIIATAPSGEFPETAAAQESAVPFLNPELLPSDIVKLIEEIFPNLFFQVSEIEKTGADGDENDVKDFFSTVQKAEPDFEEQAYDALGQMPQLGMPDLSPAELALKQEKPQPLQKRESELIYEQMMKGRTSAEVRQLSKEELIKWIEKAREYRKKIRDRLYKRIFDREEPLPPSEARSEELTSGVTSPAT